MPSFTGIIADETIVPGDISPTVIQYWRKQLKDGGLSEGPSAKEKELEKELTAEREVMSGS